MPLKQNTCMHISGAQSLAKLTNEVSNLIHSISANRLLGAEIVWERYYRPTRWQPIRPPKAKYELRFTKL